jgi:DNA-binding XRE family transcriptional regulator
MTDSNKLKAIFVEAGKKQSDVAKMLGISLTCLNNKILNKVEFKATEIQKLCDAFNIKEKEAIFFANNVEYKSTNK